MSFVTKTGQDFRCTKRQYGSEAHARAAHRSAGYRIRAYLCPDCHSWHTTNAEKAGLSYSEAKTLRGSGTHQPESRLGPALTLAQVQAIAAQKRGLAA